MIKETKQKNKFRHVMSKMKKPLMIFSIILNILFGLALVIGLSSKSKAQSVSASDNQITDLTGTSWRFNKYSQINNFSQNLGQEGLSINATYTATDLNGNTYGVVGDYVYYMLIPGTTNNAFDFFVCSNYISSSSYTDKLDLYKQSANTSSLKYTYRRGNSYSSISLGDVESYVTFTGGSDITNPTLISFMYLNATLLGDDSGGDSSDNTNNYVKSITLGDNFNPVTYITKNGDYILNGFAGLNDDITANFVDLIGLDFMSNGFEYNRIRLVFAELPAVAPYITQDGTNYISTSDYTNYACCIGMFYQYIDSSNVITRNVQVLSYRRTIIDDNGVQIKCYDVRQPYSIWINNNYKQIDVISDTEEVITNSVLTISGLSSYELLQVTSSVNTSVMGLTDVFGLLKGAFSGISGILAISILPGITLGLLLFIPLIVTIIIAVVRLIKK